MKDRNGILGGAFMGFATCSRCNRLFEALSNTTVCPNCYQAHEEEFKVIRKYIREHPNANIVEVSGACNIPIPQIRRWIKEERISYKEDSKIGIECERCGKMINTGRYCVTCKTEMLKDFKSTYNQGMTSSDDKNKESNKMRFLNQNSNKNK